MYLENKNTFPHELWVNKQITVKLDYIKFNHRIANIQQFLTHKNGKFISFNLICRNKL